MTTIGLISTIEPRNKDIKPGLLVSMRLLLKAEDQEWKQRDISDDEGACIVGFVLTAGGVDCLFNGSSESEC